MLVSKPNSIEAYLNNRCCLISLYVQLLVHLHQCVYSFEKLLI